MTHPASAKITAFFNDHGDRFAQLAFRWLDEHEYENIDEYRKVLEPLAVSKDIHIDRMTKRPFGFFATCENTKFKIVCTARGRPTADFVR